MCHKDRCGTSSDTLQVFCLLSTLSKGTKDCGRKHKSSFQKSNCICLDNIVVLSSSEGHNLGTLFLVQFCIFFFNIVV